MFGFNALRLCAGVLMLAAAATAASAQNATPASLNAAVLPSSRATATGTAVTVFATLVNSGDTGATGCSVSIPSKGNPSGIGFSYQAFQADNSTPAAAPDTPVDIAGHASQAFVLSLNPSTVFAGTNITFAFRCSSGETAPVIPAVNTLFLTASSAPSPDIVTISVTKTNNGVVQIPSLGGGELMSVAALNIGIGDTAATKAKTVIVAPDTGEISLPLDIFVCETDPATSVCKATPSATVTTTVSDVPSTFAVFANSTRGAGVANFPDMARLHLRFYDGGAGAPDQPQKHGASTPQNTPAGAGAVFGATSSGVTSPGPDSSATDFYPEGIWHMRAQDAAGAFTEATVMVNVEGGMTIISHTPDSAPFPPVDALGQGFFSDTNPPNGAAQRTFTSGFTRLTEDASTGDFTVATSYASSGNWFPKKEVTGQLTPNGQQPGTFKMVYTGEYDKSFALPGSYQIVSQDSTTGKYTSGGTLTIASDFSFTGSLVPGTGQTCTITGSITGYGNGKNLFSMDMTMAGSTCPMNGDNLVGDAFVHDPLETPLDGTILGAIEGALFPTASGAAGLIMLFPQGGFQ